MNVLVIGQWQVIRRRDSHHHCCCYCYCILQGKGVDEVSPCLPQPHRISATVVVPQGSTSQGLSQSSQPDGILGALSLDKRSRKVICAVRDSEDGQGRNPPSSPWAASGCKFPVWHLHVCPLLATWPPPKFLVSAPISCWDRSPARKP